MASKMRAPEDILDSLRKRCGGSGITLHAIAQKFKAFDRTKDGKLSKQELVAGFEAFNLPLSHSEADRVLLMFDRDADGYVTYDEFLMRLRGGMNKQRQATIRYVFDNVLDTDKSGTVEFEEIKSRYNASKHPEVVSGLKSEDEILREFMFRLGDKNRDGMITFEEFQDYYNGLSASIDRDEYFDIIVKKAWGLEIDSLDNSAINSQRGSARSRRSSLDNLRGSGGI